MSQDVRPFRKGATALFLIAAMLFGLGIWAHLMPQPAHPAAEMITRAVAPALRDSLAPVLGQPETTFGLFARVGGATALLGLFLLTLRRREPAAPAAPQRPRVIPRRPADLRAARRPHPTA
jgi:hypothetical protein